MSYRQIVFISSSIDDCVILVCHDIFSDAPAFLRVCGSVYVCVIHDILSDSNKYKMWNEIKNKKEQQQLKQILLKWDRLRNVFEKNVVWIDGGTIINDMGTMPFIQQQQQKTQISIKIFNVYQVCGSGAQLCPLTQPFCQYNICIC